MASTLASLLHWKGARQHGNIFIYSIALQIKYDLKNAVQRDTVTSYEQAN